MQYNPFWSIEAVEPFQYHKTNIHEILWHQKCVVHFQLIVLQKKFFLHQPGRILACWSPCEFLRPYSKVMLLLLQRDVDFALAYHRRHHGDVYVGGQYAHAVNVSAVQLFYYVVVVLPLWVIRNTKITLTFMIISYKWRKRRGEKLSFLK